MDINGYHNPIKNNTKPQPRRNEEITLRRASAILV